MKNTGYDVIHSLFVTLVVLLIVYLTFDPSFGVNYFIINRMYLSAGLISILYLGIAITGSVFVTLYIDKINKSNNMPFFKMIIPFFLPLILFLILGFVATNYFSFAVSALTALISSRLYSFLRKQKSPILSIKLRIMFYTIMMSSMWLLSILMIFMLNN